MLALRGMGLARWSMAALPEYTRVDDALVKVHYKGIRGSHRGKTVVANRKFNWYLNGNFRCGVLPTMAEEKSRSKDIILWIITVLLIALAIFWYKR
jgi:hypothetical protein